MITESKTAWSCEKQVSLFGCRLGQGAILVPAGPFDGAALAFRILARRCADFLTAQVGAGLRCKPAMQNVERIRDQR